MNGYRVGVSSLGKMPLGKWVMRKTPSVGVGVGDPWIRDLGWKASECRPWDTPDPQTLIGRSQDCCGCWLCGTELNRLVPPHSRSIRTTLAGHLGDTSNASLKYNQIPPDIFCKYTFTYRYTFIYR